MQGKDGLGARLMSWTQNKKKATGLLIVLLVTALLLWFGGDLLERKRSGQKETVPVVPTETEQSDALEERLVAVLSRIRGAGKVSVMITYETTGETVTATISRTDENIQSNGTMDSRSATEVTEPATVQTDLGQSPIVLMEREPVVRGVIVVAEGAADLGVRMNLQRAVRAVTGASLDAIEVFEMSYGS